MKMSYLKLDYNVKGLLEGDKKDIEELLLPIEKEYFDKFKEVFPNYIIPEINLVISDDIWTDIKKFYSSHGENYEKPRPKGLDHLIKIVSSKKGTKYFWSSRYL